MRRIPRNPGSGKPSSNAPSRGPGWGGPAKGAGTGGERAVVAGPAPAETQRRDPETGKFLLSPKSEAAELVAQEALGRIVTIMRTTPIMQQQMDAALAVQQRIWGAPKETVSTENVHRVVADRPMSSEEWADKYAPKEPPSAT